MIDEHYDMFASAAAAAVARAAMAPPGRITVARAALGNRAGVLGAARAAMGSRTEE
jgi:hypothetical protein